MTWSVNVTGHVDDPGTEEKIVTALEQFVVELMGELNTAEDGSRLVSAYFSGMHIGGRTLNLTELQKEAHGYRSTDAELQQHVDELARDTGAEGNA